MKYISNGQQMAVDICEVYTFQVSKFMNKLKSKTNIQLEILIQITFNFQFFSDISINEQIFSLQQF